MVAAVLAAGPTLAQQGTPDADLRRGPGDRSPQANSAPRDAGVPVATPGPSAAAPAVGPYKPLTEAEAAAFASALKAIDQGRYGDARAMVANFGNPLLARYIDWSILRTAPRTEATFPATWRFLRENPDWPEPEVLRRQAEDRIGPEHSPGEVVRYFTAFPPLTSRGHLRRLEAAQAASPGDVPRFASDSWQTATFRSADENEFLNRYGQLLKGPDYIARFDRILRDGRHPVARDLVPKLPPDYQPVAEARLAMATKAADAPKLVLALPAARFNDPAIALEHLQWLRRTGSLDTAKALLMAPTVPQTDAWWNERNQIARELLAAGRAGDAYALTVPHGFTKGIAFAEAEFLAGWIALRHLKRPADALKHFQTLYDGVSADSLRGRGAYWLGRTHEAANRSKEASDWYGRAAAFGQTFYGQLAARKLPAGSARLPSDPVATPVEDQAFGGRELVAVARHLGQAGDHDRARPFLLRLARLITVPGETALLSQLALELKQPDVALTIARRGSANGVVLFDALFPVVDLGQTGSIERALALALTRQESSFNAAAVSSSGALGLMQLLPDTARDVAGRLKIPFIQENLTRDPAYNVQLGSQYIAEMLKRFGGSYEIAMAAYNAGPTRVARWLKTMGDPRDGKIDMVDWIETIPFRETRYYVQHIMEGVVVYRERLNGTVRTVPPATGRS
ncbi:MAG: lytic transglycosylase domain-containing protein [Reyranellaceae bacterium]